MQYNYDQIGNDKLKAAMNLLVDDEGICQLRPLLTEKKEETMLEYLERTNPYPERAAK